MKPFGHGSASFLGTVDRDRDDECPLLCHVVCAFDGKIPLVTKVAFVPIFRMPRDDRYEQATSVDSLADLNIPRVAAAQFALIQPDLNTVGLQGLGNAPRSLRVLGGIAYENSFSCVRHDAPVMRDSRLRSLLWKLDFCRTVVYRIFRAFNE